MNEIAEEEKNPEKTFDLHISNEELARLAYDDAESLKEEADSLDNVVADLRKEATEKQNQSIAQKSQAESQGLNSDSASSLLEQSEINQNDAREKNQFADELTLIASAKEMEADAAKKDADEIFKSSKTSNVIASNNKRSINNNQSKNHSDSTKEDAALKTVDEQATVEANKSVVANEIVDEKKQLEKDLEKKSVEELFKMFK